MPRIIQTLSQNQALSKVKANIKSIDGINQFLRLYTDSGLICFHYADKTLKFPASKEYADSIMEGIRKNLVAETIKLSKSNSIELSESDEQILNNKTDEERQ